MLTTCCRIDFPEVSKGLVVKWVDVLRKSNDVRVEDLNGHGKCPGFVELIGCRNTNGGQMGMLRVSNRGNVENQNGNVVNENCFGELGYVLLLNGNPGSVVPMREEGERVGRGEMGRRPREGNDERVEDLNGHGNDQGLGANGV
ncbi:hypothetical protein Tco_0170033 [Tanacetum coccineum]